MNIGDTVYFLADNELNLNDHSDIYFGKLESAEFDEGGVEYTIKEFHHEVEVVTYTAFKTLEEAIAFKLNLISNLVKQYQDAIDRLGVLEAERGV